MTSRERFLTTLSMGSPDRVPILDEGIRDDVLDIWRAQGLPASADIGTMFPTDARERLPLSLEPHPAVDRWPRSLREVSRLRKLLDPADPSRRPADWNAMVEAWRRRDHVLEMQVHRGFFLTMGVDGWERFEEVVLLLRDNPALAHAILDAFGDFSAALVERTLDDVEIDCAIISEPIGGNDRPLIGPDDYARFVLASYGPVIEVLRRRGVPNLILLTFANARLLIRSALDAGINCLWACEANPEAMDYRALRREFGRDLRLIGGIDLDAVRLGPDAIRAEMEALLPPLLADGGFIPLADGRVRPDIPFEHYAYYRRLLVRMTSRPGA
ncbi:MAG TPA: uroporphyrinogen decarboxylase family protein [Chthonomonadales bacterium]|nr:uroporphyrinogen decarboxylase family protein [Chthonomonadales bacterium]